MSLCSVIVTIALILLITSCPSVTLKVTLAKLLFVFVKSVERRLIG